MAVKMRFCAVISALATLILTVLYWICKHGILLSLAITAGTVLYHFAMRLAVGAVVNALMHNRADATRLWFRPHAFEKKLYARLGIRKWRERMPTYDPSLFSLEQHSVQEILGASCQAEVVHEIIVLLSFLPLLSVPCFGAFWVFFITSLLAAAYDSLFVLMQRYARPHLLCAAQRTEQKKETDHDPCRSV
jgi:hypothetical protein